MKAGMAIWVQTFSRWAPSALALYIQMIDAEIKMKQGLRIAALKAQRWQRKTQREAADERA